MKVFKFLVFLILLAIIGGTIYFGAKDSSYDITQSKTIKAPIALVFNTVNEYKTWEHWGPWKSEDPTMTFIYPKNTSGIGAGYSWNGQWSGSIKTEHLVQEASIEQTLIINTPAGERYPKANWTFTSATNRTTNVTWRIQGKHSLMDKVYFTLSGKDFNSELKYIYLRGIEGLENYAIEEMKKYSISESTLTEYGGGFYLYKTSSASTNNISAIITQNHNEIVNFMAQNNIISAGMPFTIYLEKSSDGVVMSNAIPVREKVAIAGDTNILIDYLPTTKAVKTTLKGDYAYLNQAWDKATQYVAQHKLETNTVKPFEIYGNNPKDLPNPAIWITELYIPIK